MKLVDINLLLYAIDSSSSFHSEARKWLEDALSSPETVYFPWVVLLGFVRIGTRNRVFAQPLSVEEAFDYVDEWLARPNVSIVHPTERHTQILRDLLTSTGTAGNLVQDAHIAALAIEYGATVFSADHDFTRFKGLRFVNPLK